MNKSEFLVLLDKYLAGNASEQEEHLLMKIYNDLEAKNARKADEIEHLDFVEKKLIERFTSSIAASIPASQIIRRPLYNKTIFRVAASLLLILGFSAIFWLKYNHTPEPQFATLLINNPAGNFVTEYNDSKEIKKITFPDGSYANLAKNARVKYERKFTGKRRIVYLIGEGFFQVAKNHKKPFIVVTDKVVAKVLGTSFIINSGLNNQSAGVVVKTGKVSVFKTKDFTEANARPELVSGLVLTPNHMAALNNKDVFERKLATLPEVIKPALKNDFDFDNTPISVVFDRLQTAYGIAIQYDKDKMSSCSLSVSMGKEGFYEKLNVICRTINASYRIIDGNVVINGTGCTNNLIQ